jgi:hypothetical protein
MRREISFEDQEWFIHTHSGSFADAQFAELDDHPCTPAEDAFLWVTVLLMAASPLIVAFFAVL